GETGAERITKFFPAKRAPRCDDDSNGRHKIQNVTAPWRLGVIPKDGVGAEELRHLVKQNLAPRLQPESRRESTGLGFFEKQKVPVPERMGQVPPNRGPVADEETANADGERLNGKFAPKKKQQPKRHDRNQKEFHAPECDSTDEAEEKKVACASGVFLFDDQKKNDERRDEQKVECVTARLEMPL